MSKQTLVNTQCSRMLSNNLNTNEIKDAAGAEQEFQHLEQPGRTRKFALIGMVPSLPHLLTLSHQETGSGIKLRRRSLVRFDLTELSGVDTITPITNSAYLVTDFAVGHLASLNGPKKILANLGSFTWSLGASTTILYDGTGNGSVVCLNGLL